MKEKGGGRTSSAAVSEERLKDVLGVATSALATEH